MTYQWLLSSLAQTALTCRRDGVRGPNDVRMQMLSFFRHDDDGDLLSLALGPRWRAAATKQLHSSLHPDIACGTGRSNLHTCS